MTQTPEPSPRAQAILRAIENEAQARRERMERDAVPAVQTPPVAPLEPPVGQAEPLGEAADRLMRLVDHVVAQTEGVRARVREVERSLDLLSDKLAEPVAPTPPQTLKPAFEEKPAAVVTIEPPEPIVVAPEPVVEPPEPVVEPPEPVVVAPEPVVEPPAPEPVVAEAPAPPPPPEPDPAPAPVAPQAGESDGARLMAIEMAVSGSSRGEVGDRLAHDFGVKDPTPFLDDVFGAGSADDSRMPWTS